MLTSNANTLKPCDENSEYLYDINTHCVTALCVCVCVCVCVRVCVCVQIFLQLQPPALAYCCAPTHSSSIIIQLANWIYVAGYAGTSFNGKCGEKRDLCARMILDGRGFTIYFSKKVFTITVMLDLHIHGSQLHNQ